MGYYFIGQDGSMGLKFGKKYRVSFVIDGPMHINAVIRAEHDIVHCPYSNVATVLDNWSIFPPPQEEG